MEEHLPAPTWFLSLRAYGTRLPGAPEGWTSRATPGAPGRFHRPNPALEHYCRERLRWSVMVFTADARRLIEAIARRTCAERGWVVRALTVTQDHVHAVITADDDPREVRRRLKRDTTLELKYAGLREREAQVWVDYGNVCRLFDDGAILAACDYVNAHHGDAPTL